MDTPREIQIYQSCNRPNLLLGCDRELVLLLGIMCAALIFTVATMWAVAIGAALWVGAVAMLARMAKVDPMLRHVYVRHVKYQSYYPAKSGLRAQASAVGNGWR